MRTLIFGASGMLGHKLAQKWREQMELWATVRGSAGKYLRLGIFHPDRLIPGLEVERLDQVAAVLDRVRPDAVINCVGVVKQLPLAKDPIASLQLNALWPHQLARMCSARGARMIHISTDCVFSGRKGSSYQESDPSDADDLYGRTKFLGEVEATGVLTLRTSIIGRELGTRQGLVEWLRSQSPGTVKGFTGAIYSGVTTLTLADALSEVLQRHPTLQGVYHLASEPITKYELLVELRQALGLDVEIQPAGEVRVDRSLDGSRFTAATRWRAPDWKTMCGALKADSKFYESSKEGT